MQNLEYDGANQILRQSLALTIMGDLEACDFVEEDKLSENHTRFKTKERVFIKEVSKDIFVKVYTSIVGFETRSSGKDAVRVCMLYKDSDGKFVPLKKERRVNRTGLIPDISARVVSRINSVISTVSSLEKCTDCGAPTKEFKRRRDGVKFTACANFCVKKGLVKRKFKEEYEPVAFEEYARSIGASTASRESVDNLLKSDPIAVESAIITLYNYQTEDEQQHHYAGHNNGKGFSAYCAGSGTFYAKWILGLGRSGNKEYRCKHLKEEYLLKARKMVLRHSRQLVEEPTQAKPGTPREEPQQSPEFRIEARLFC